MRLYPAIDVAAADADLVAAMIDEFSPTAIEERDETVRAFFATSDLRDSARAALIGRFPVEAIDVSDEDWARRSQENLQPIAVGGITIVPTRSAIRDSRSAITLVIEPSMGFGTGHHATTRLCLEALQQMEVRGTRVVDVGTGSGVLAIAAARLGAVDAIGIDVDADAIQSARENLTFNPDAAGVRFAVADFVTLALPPADIVLANLTGALLQRAAERLRAATTPEGVLIVSGLQSDERDDVIRALAPKKILWQREEDSWVGLAMRQS